MAEKKYKNGARYVGSVNSEGERNGQGTYYYTSGATWSGTWRNGDKHGYGTEKAADGTITKGNWNSNVYVGEPAKTTNTNTKTKLVFRIAFFNFGFALVLEMLVLFLLFFRFHCCYV